MAFAEAVTEAHPADPVLTTAVGRRGTRPRRTWATIPGSAGASPAAMPPAAVVPSNQVPADAAAANPAGAAERARILAEYEATAAGPPNRTSVPHWGGAHAAAGLWGPVLCPGRRERSRQVPGLLPGLPRALRTPKLVCWALGLAGRTPAHAQSRICGRSPATTAPAPLRPRLSRRLAAFIALTHAGAAGLYPGLAGLLALAGRGAWPDRVVWPLAGIDPPLATHPLGGARGLLGEDGWELTLGSGRRVQARLAPSTYVGPRLVVLNFRGPSWRRCSLVLPPDALDPDLLRRWVAG